MMSLESSRSCRIRLTWSMNDRNVGLSTTYSSCAGSVVAVIWHLPFRLNAMKSGLGEGRSGRWAEAGQGIPAVESLGIAERTRGGVRTKDGARQRRRVD